MALGNGTVSGTDEHPLAAGTEAPSPGGPAAATAICGGVRGAGGGELVSVLYPDAGPGTRAEAGVQPEYFSDLNLDQFVSSVTRGREEYDLAPFLCQHLEDPGTVSYRQEVFRDLEDPVVFEQISAFAQAMREVRECLAQAEQLHYHYQAESWFVDAVDLYCGAVSSLARELAQLELRSRGMRGLRGYLAEHVASRAFTGLVSGSQQVHQGLSAVHYCVNIRGGRVRVAKYDGEADYSTEVLATFERFEQGAAKDYRVAFSDPPEMNHIEANVLTLVARLYPEVFARLDEYCNLQRDFLDPVVRRFDREVQFYMSYLEHLGALRSAGLCFCYPEVTRRSKEIFAEGTFDLVLAKSLLSTGSTVVCNDFYLSGPERVLVVSGPNQGGKTTFARMFGQLHHLATIGCPVPGRKARLYLFDQLYTHFEREEDLSNLTGKLEDDLLRTRQILSVATTDSIVVMNEIFASTTLRDSLFLATKVMARLVELDVLSVFVTFVDELATFAPSTVSMVSTIVPANPAERTYKVVRRPADGLAYALAIAEKYGVTYDALKKRVSS